MTSQKKTYLLHKKNNWREWEENQYTQNTKVMQNVHKNQSN